MTIPKWSSARAKANLSRVLDGTRRQAQMIERRGQEVAVVLGIDDYRRLEKAAAQTAPQQRLTAFLDFSAQIRRAGGGAIKPTRRTPRESPLGGRGLS